MENNTKLTEEQIESIVEQMDEAIAGSELEKIAQFPSNQGKEETNPEDRETGEFRNMNIQIDPNTGEHKILGSAGLNDEETFEEMCERIKNSDIEFDSKPITEKEIIDYIANEKDNSMLGEISKEIDEISPEAIRGLLDIVNRKMNKEDFNIYKSFPAEIREMIDNYLSASKIPINSQEGKQFRNFVSEQLVMDFVSNININRTMHDFNKEIEDIFKTGSSEIADSVVGYTEERNKKYREHALQMEDEEKKERLLSVLDAIDMGYKLDNLKEYAKKCKIKKFDLEKPSRIYSGFLRKYENSSYNIYDINLARPTLYRNINPADNELYSQKDIDAFFICFCKFSQNMSPDNVEEHSFMYYTLFNIVLMDMNKGNSKDVSEKFLENIKDVIHNLRERNNNFN